MPPQQPDRLLDLFYQPFDFGAHDGLGFAGSDSRYNVWKEAM
jgi:hypothetical protein